jgi:RNA polymerase sigma-70 factor (ECF subfamily)
VSVNGNPLQTRMNEEPEPSDETLLRRLRKGNEEAFVTLYRRHQGAVYRFAVRMSGSPSEAEEVTQEVFLALIRGMGGFNPSRGPLLAWLLGSARNHLRKRSGNREWHLALDGAGEPLEIAAAGHPLDDLTRGEKRESVRQAVRSLPEKYREAVVLCDLEELSYEDAARALDCPIGTLRSRLHRGRELMAEKLRAQVMTERP